MPRRWPMRIQLSHSSLCASSGTHRRPSVCGPINRGTIWPGLGPGSQAGGEAGRRAPAPPPHPALRAECIAWGGRHRGHASQQTSPRQTHAHDAPLLRVRQLGVVSCVDRLAREWCSGPHQELREPRCDDPATEADEKLDVEDERGRCCGAGLSAARSRSWSGARRMHISRLELFWIGALGSGLVCCASSSESRSRIVLRGLPQARQKLSL